MEYSIFSAFLLYFIWWSVVCLVWCHFWWSSAPPMTFWLPFTIVSYTYLWHFSFILNTNYKLLIPDSPYQPFVVFSIYTNGKKLFSCKKFGPTSGVIECLDGIRVITTVWVVFIHAFRNYQKLPLHDATAYKNVNLILNSFAQNDSEFLKHGNVLPWLFHSISVHGNVSKCDLQFTDSSWHIFCNEWFIGFVQIAKTSQKVREFIQLKNEKTIESVCFYNVWSDVIYVLQRWKIGHNFIVFESIYANYAYAGGSNTCIRINIPFLWRWSTLAN